MYKKSSPTVRELGDEWVVHSKIKNKFLDKVNQLVDWDSIEDALAPAYADDKGRPYVSVQVLLKLLLLESWHGLSDHEVICRAAESFSWCRFLRIGPHDDLPDPSTLSVFRKRLQNTGGDAALFAMVNEKMSHAGYAVANGKGAVDAKLVKSKHRPDGTPVSGNAPIEKDAK